MVMMDGTSYWHAAYAPEIDGVRGFFDFVSRHDVETTFELYDVIERSRDEAIVVCNKTVSIRTGDDPRSVVQVSLETVRRGSDGAWRLARYWAEKARIDGWSAERR
jgi:hypothetical protein